MRYKDFLYKFISVLYWIKFLDSCNDGEFQCEQPLEKCIPTIWMCDGRNDCPDGSDEHAHVCHQHSAGSGCFGDQPECVYLGVTRCIMHEWLCDGRTDCDNNIDESNCTHVNVTNPGEKPLLSPINLPSRMQPGVSLAEVIRKNQIMQAGSLNGLPGCQPFEFQCKSSECIIRDLLCDDTKDCPDGSDESEEKCATPPGIPVVEPPHSFPDSAELSTIEPYGELNGLLSPIDINQPKSLPILTSTTLWPNMASFGEIPSPELATEAVERNLVTSTEVIESIDLSTKQETTVENYPQPFLPITGGPPLPPAGLEPMILPSDVNLPQIPVNSIPDQQANENLPQENTPVVESVNPNLFTSTLGMPAIIPLRGLLGIPLPTKLKENDQKTEPIVPFPFVPINQDGDKRETVGNEIPFTASGSPFSVTNVLPDETFGKSRVLSPLAVDLIDEMGVITKIFVEDNLIPIIPINAPANYKIMVPIHATIKKKVKIYTSSRLESLASTSAGVDDDQDMRKRL